MSHPNLRPVVKRSAEALAIDALRAHVLSGGATPGERLTETALATRLQVSRATIRAALHKLTTERLVHQIPYTGWEVARLTVHDAWELYTLRSSLEALAARLATERGGPDVEAGVREAFVTLERACHARNPVAISEGDFGLHKTIIRLAQHNRLLEQYRLIEQQTRLYIHSSNALIRDPQQILADHEPIVTAILAGRAAQAAKLSEKHNITDGESVVAYLNSKSVTGKSS
jgi:DNA-binding GntR family transcriptional regulator